MNMWKITWQFCSPWIDFQKYITDAGFWSFADGFYFSYFWVQRFKSWAEKFCTSWCETPDKWTQTNTHTHFLRAGHMLRALCSTGCLLWWTGRLTLTAHAHSHTHTNSQSRICIKPHTHTHTYTLEARRQTHSQIVCHDCISDASFLRAFVWNRWELIVLPSWISSGEICQIKMSLQSSF